MILRKLRTSTSLRHRITLLSSIFRLSIENLLGHLMRTILTLLGIIVGVAAIIAVVTIIEGLNLTVANTFSANGSTVFTLSRSPLVVTSREEMIKVAKRKDITRSDADTVARLCSECWRIGYWIRGTEIVKHADNTAENVMIRGATGSILDIEGLGIDSGRTWTAYEETSGQYVALVGADIVKNLFDGVPAEDVIGEEIRVGGDMFRIIGVIASQGTIFGVSRDNFVIVPFQTAQTVLPIKESLIIDIQVRDAADLENAKDQVRTIMRSRRGKITTFVGDEKQEDEGFTVESADVFIDLYKDATDNIYLVTIGVSAISLVVGGIVVMNIMLVSVAERTKEIGLRMAVGARRKDILIQFLAEAVTIASVGGVIGIFTGFGLAALISLAIGFPTLINTQSAVLGVAVSSLVGIVSGLYPAWRAARLDPVEAMRQE